MTTVYARAPAVRVEEIGNAWAAFSALSGETLMLNDEAAAILEILAQGPSDADHICAELANDSGCEVSGIIVRTRDTWSFLVQAGLVLALADCRPQA